MNIYILFLTLSLRILIKLYFHIACDKSIDILIFRRKDPSFGNNGEPGKQEHFIENISRIFQEGSSKICHLFSRRDHAVAPRVLEYKLCMDYFVSSHLRTWGISLGS